MPRDCRRREHLYQRIQAEPDQGHRRRGRTRRDRRSYPFTGETISQMSKRQAIFLALSICHSPVRRHSRRTHPADRNERNTMKYMLIMRATDEALEASKNMDFEELMNAMGAYNESMIKAGVLLAGEGLSDAKEGFVVDFAAEKPIVTDGPYGETHELFNGFWIIEVSGKEEAAEWASRAPLGPGTKLEVRRVTDESDFAEFADNEYVQKEAGWREQLAAQSQGS
jgi:hypothetical protein